MTMKEDFTPNKKIERIQGKDYLPVRWRLVWFHQDTGPKAGYVTVELEHDRQAGFAKFFTLAWNGEGEEWRPVKINGIELDVCGRVATGEGSETRADFNDYYEKAATKSLGRALAGLSYGTQFAPEMDEKHRVVDTPSEPRGHSARAPEKPSPVVTSPTTLGALKNAMLRAGLARREDQEAFMRACGVEPSLEITLEQINAVFVKLQQRTVGVN